MTVAAKPNDPVGALDHDLAELSVEGYWKSIGALPAEPTPRAEAFVWRWSDIHPKLYEASELIDLEQGAERRSLRLCTPGVAWKATTDVIHAAIQMVLPGEVAKAHRHSPAALRFVIDGNGGYTTVNGERCLMEPSDLVLTPQTCWHDHGNKSDRPIIWMDVLDFPFVRMLNAVFSEDYGAREQEVVKPDGYGRRLAGPARPASLASPPTGFAHHYKGAESIALLRELGPEDGNAYDGITLDYLNPLTGGPTMPTVQCRMHRLTPGQVTRRHRHTWNTIYHVVEGAGETIVGDETLSWGAHDTIALPAWHWHEHHCGDGGEAVMFSVTDEPIYRAFALDRMEDTAG